VDNFHDIFIDRERSNEMGPDKYRICVPDTSSRFLSRARSSERLLYEVHKSASVFLRACLYERRRETMYGISHLDTIEIQRQSAVVRIGVHMRAYTCVVDDVITRSCATAGGQASRRHLRASRPAASSNVRSESGATRFRDRYCSRERTGRRSAPGDPPSASGMIASLREARETKSNANATNNMRGTL